MCGYICTLRKTTAKNSQSDLSDSTILAKDIVHLFRWNLKRQIPTSKQSKFRGGTTVTSSPSKVGVRPRLPNTDKQEEYPRSQRLPSFPYMELWSYLTYSILFTSGGKRTWKRRRGKKRRRRRERRRRRRVACFILLWLASLVHRPSSLSRKQNSGAKVPILGSAREWQMKIAEWHLLE